MNNDQFLQNTNGAMYYTIEFVLVRISYFTPRKDQRMLRRLVKFLTTLFSRLNHHTTDVSLKIVAEKIGQLIFTTIKDVNNYKLRQHLALLITEILRMKDVCLSDAHAIDLCVSEVFSCLQANSVVLVKLAETILSVSPKKCLNKDNGLYFWIQTDCPELLDEPLSQEIKFSILNCISLTLKNKEENDISLTEVLKSKFSSLYDLMDDCNYQEKTLEIFCYIIKDLSSTDVLPLMDSEFQRNIDSLDIMKRESVYNKDLILIINYICYLQSAKRINKEEIVNILTARCTSNNTDYPLITLKALCFWYPMMRKNLAPTTETLIGDNILNAIAVCRCLSNILTYHRVQFQWFMESKRPKLMLDVLQLWIVNHSNNDTIISVLKDTDNAQLLIKCLLMDASIDILRRIVQLLSKLQSPSMAISLKRNIPSSLDFENSFACLLQANPALPDEEKEYMFFCDMMSNVLPNLTNKEAFIRACSYTSKLLIKFKKDPKALEAVVSNENCIQTICEAASSDEDGTALAAVNLLIVFLKLQKRQRTNVRQTVAIDFKKLIRGSPVRLSKSILLLNFVLNCSTTDFIISMKKEDAIDVYRYLQGLELDAVYSQIFRTLRNFIKRYSYLAFSAVTAIYVMMHCECVEKTEEQIEEFMMFLRAWASELAKRSAMEYYFPKKEVNEFMTRRAKSHQKDEELLHLLEKLSLED